MSQEKKDQVYLNRLAEIKQFRFDEKVAVVFDDMVSRSVPRYAEVQNATVKLALKLCPSGGKIVDLGCSTGTALFAIAEAAKEKDLELIGIDNSPEMLVEAEKKAQALGLSDRVSFICADIAEYKVSEVDLFIVNYTLQFIPVSGRTEIVSEMYKALRKGGGIILTEKIRHSGEAAPGILQDLYYDFKAEQGYSKLEISQKREALEGFLVPLTLEENLSLLRESGFNEVELYLKWITFATFLGLKR